MPNSTHSDPVRVQLQAVAMVEAVSDITAFDDDGDALLDGSSKSRLLRLGPCSVAIRVRF